MQGRERFTWTFPNPSLEVNGFLPVPSTLPTETCFCTSWSSPPCTEAPPSRVTVQKKGVMNGEQQYVLLAPQKSARMLWYLTLGCTLLRNPSLFSCKKIQKIHRKQKIRSSHDYYRKAENSPNPTTKTTPLYTAPIMLLHVFWLRCCIKQLSLPFSTPEEFYTVWTE